MAAGKHNFTIEQGADFDPFITYRNPPVDPINDPDTPGAPIDITGFGARMQVRTASKNGTIVLDLDIAGSEIVLTDPVNGQLQIQVPAATTAALTAAQFTPIAFYDLELIDLSGRVIRLLEGTVKFSAEVTV
jgi:hypothetical protein